MHTCRNERLIHAYGRTGVLTAQMIPVGSRTYEKHCGASESAAAIRLAPGADTAEK